MTQDQRRQARVLAFSCQYQRQKLGYRVESEALLFETANLSSKNLEFAKTLVLSIEQQQDEIDRLIGTHSRSWKQSRLLESLNALLRVSIAELLSFPQTDTNVILNESIEICRGYVGERSIKLFNGILHAVSKEVRLA